MAMIDIYDFLGKKVSQENFDDALFLAEIKPYLHTEVVSWQRASRRSGTQSALTKSEVTGSTKKPFAQKGRGMARQGSARKNPHQIGGGVAFAPKPRDYSYAMPKSKKRAALASVLSARFSTGSIKVLDKAELAAPKTKSMVEFLKNFNIDSCLFVDFKNNNLRLSSRNHPDIKYIQLQGINVEDILRFPNLVMTVDAVRDLEKRLIA